MLYTGNQPIFDIYGVERGIQNALEKRVNLKSAAISLLSKPKTMTTIDINTGAFADIEI